MTPCRRYNTYVKFGFLTLKPIFMQKSLPQFFYTIYVTRWTCTREARFKQLIIMHFLSYCIIDNYSSFWLVKCRFCSTNTCLGDYNLLKTFVIYIYFKNILCFNEHIIRTLNICTHYKNTIYSSFHNTKKFNLRKVSHYLYLTETIPLLMFISNFKDSNSSWTKNTPQFSTEKGFKPTCKVRLCFMSNLKTGFNSQRNKVAVCISFITRFKGLNLPGVFSLMAFS